MRQLPHSRRGFTIMEVLVALFISALVMTSVLGSLDYTRSAVDAIYNVIETESVGPRVMDLIREDLSRVAVYDAAEYTVMLGENDSIRGADADRLDFIVYRRSTRAKLDYRLSREIWAPVNEVGYRLRANRNLDEFMELYRREDFLTDDEPFKDGTFTLLYDRITNFDIKYFKRPELDPSWEDEWDSKELEALPYGIQIDLELEIQPRKSKESLEILGANRARLAFSDFITIPEETRWVLRQRLHPVLPSVDGGGNEGAGGPGSGDGESGIGGTDSAGGGSSTGSSGGQDSRPPSGGFGGGG